MITLLIVWACIITYFIIGRVVTKILDHFKLIEIDHTYEGCEQWDMFWNTFLFPIVLITIFIKFVSDAITNIFI